MKQISKNLILSVSIIFLYATHVYAQGSITQANSPNGSTNTIVSSTVNYKNSSYAYTVNDGKNSVNVGYGDKTQEVQDDTPSKTKSFTKSFSIDKNDKINLSNQYGSITIKTWDKNEIKVDVDLKAYAKTESEAQKLLDDVSVKANKVEGFVSYETEIGSPNGKWNSNAGKVKWKREVKVHYTVYMPMVNALTASQQYGNIIMGDFSGPTSIKIQYGNLTAGNLNNTNNYLSIQYGKGDVKNMGGADIKHQYGNGLTIGTISNTLNLNAQYTSVKVAAVKGAATIKHQYGNGTTIGSVSGSLNVNTQYCTIKIGTLRGNLISKAQYGKVIIDEIDADKNVDIDAQYTNVNLGFATNYNADFNISTSYGSFKYGANVTATRLGDDDKNYGSSKKYTGQISKGGSNTIIIKSQYSDIIFK